MKKNMLCILILCCSRQIIFCQNIPGTETPCTASAQGTAGNFIISYTIGEMPLVQSWQANGLLITQGVIQPLNFVADTSYECFTQTEVKVYPNPNPGIFSLQLAILKTGKAKTILFDASGKQLQTEEFDYNTFSTKHYNISNFSGGVFYLQLFFTQTGSNKAKKCVYTIQKLN